MAQVAGVGYSARCLCAFKNKIMIGTSRRMRHCFLALMTAVALLLIAGGARAQTVKGGELEKAVEVPFTLEGGEIVLTVSLNGLGPYYFYLDTGASNLMTPEVAQALHVRQLTAGTISGFGPDLPEVSSAIVASVQFGGVYLAHQDFKIMQLPLHIVDRGNRPRLAGLIGGDFLQDFVAQIDFDRHVARFFPKDKFVYSGAGQPLSLTLFKARSFWGELWQRPEVSATVDGKASTLYFDTGNGGGIVFFPGTARAEELLAKPGDHVHVIAAGGIGGRVRMDMMRVNGVELAGISSAAGDTPTVSVVTSKSGAMAHGDLVGALGMGLLRQFNLTIDYPHGRVYLEPRPSLHLQDKSTPVRGTGLELSKDAHDRFTVIGTIAGSPAEKAGIVAGDEIFSVNDRPVTDMAQFDYGPIERSEQAIIITIGPPEKRRTVTLEKQILLP